MASSITSTLILLTAISCALASYAAVSNGPLVGGWQPIKNVNDPEIQDVARFALTEHNKLKGAGLKFAGIISGEQQVVSGVNYKLILAASGPDGKPGKYEAVVWVKPWANFKKLTSFRSV